MASLATMKLKNVHETVSYAASNTPDHIAIEWGTRKVTYAELEQQSNSISNFLREKVGEQKNIGVMLDSSIALVSSILGIFKSGLIYAPMDPYFPEKRLQYMLNKIECEWLITGAAWLDKVDLIMKDANRKINVLLLDDEEVSRKSYDHINVFVLKTDAEHDKELAVVEDNKNGYIIFTSGSTGNPKAILGRHRSLKHFIDWEIREFGVDQSFRISLLTSPSFDPFLRDVFVPLCAGATICIPDSREKIANSAYLLQWLEQKNIHLMHLVPTLFRALITEIKDSNRLKDLRYVLIAGEMLRGSDVNPFMELFGTRIQLVNMYGPTETTLAKFFYRVQEEDANRITIPVGRPIADTNVMILNSEMQICPEGNIGNIYIRTPYISSGYYNDRDLTAAVFMKNPFTNNPQDIIYKTGDVGKMMPGGYLDLIGRADHQVKIRGFRIEPEEIENMLLKHEDIQEAIVTAKEEKGGEALLCAYIIANRELTVPELREHLSSDLPEYMIPSYFVQLEYMPLTPTGKVDRKSLPMPQAVLNIGVEYQAPNNEVEQKLVHIWERVLNIQEIGINYNFFEIGGNSINSLKIVSEIQKEFQVNISLGELFSNPTITALASSIETEDMFAHMECVVRMNRISSDKKNIFILHSLDGTVFGYKGLAERLEQDCNFYAVQGKGLIEGSALPQNLDELVSFYMHEIKQVQPKGPYIIGGHCFGIMFAYSLVQMLENQGETVEKLVVIDEQPWLNENQLKYVWLRSALSRPYKVIKRSMLRRFRKSPNNWTHDYYLRHSRKNISNFPQMTVQENFRFIEKKYKIRSKIESDIFAIKATDSVWVRFTQSYWEKMTRGKVNIIDIPGDHWNLFADPYLQGLVESFQKELKK
ncbi:MULTISPECIES: amino acid adenylation domain-containing protein [unclassified Paenibacillus]|uniref:amino acid adenylation domain-containing protein n=1 Tax=unclassified Paenibacillus TaxID=185978 RepID=UPI0009A8BC4A|nr:MULTISPECIES: amino acid adenylation domain-containing protein [unclassified Paenibacillus]SLK22654.1 amino acid adenylation domain-containing protein [Paenibacillus sp. RU5A]SOC77353.1 amino acid adenylation domain-containing protein [Paenibacillus sp. RU26A]SOC78386.1 amino acid adenylation domain-containing protein [Paenibacillus sp. RU5M]